MNCLSGSADDLTISTSLAAFENDQGSHMRYSVCPNKENRLSINESAHSSCRVFQLVEKSDNSSPWEADNTAKLSWEKVLSSF